MSSNKLTIIKVLPRGEAAITAEDLERWRKIFSESSLTVEAAMATGEVTVETIALPQEEDEHYITLVRVGNDQYYPTKEDLEEWRKVFEEAQNDPNFKIFTHEAVDISVINIGKIVSVE